VRSHATALREAEPRMQFVRQLFNDAVQAYNDAAREWPTRLLVRLYGFGTAGRL
jgi:LemA protein